MFQIVSMYNEWSCLFCSEKTTDFLVFKDQEINNSNLELEIMYKNTRNEQRPFSKSSSDTFKSLFGSPIKCELIQKKIAGEETKLFKFTNKRREAHSFTVNLFNSFSIGESVTDFSRRITNMIVSGRLNVLALYLSILPYSTGFVHHRAESHTNDGLCVDGSGIQIKDLLGLVLDYLLFVAEKKPFSRCK